ncbi:retrovirus-related pol polyprotein from transposon TNT 1-94 [Tanacetum coccineum]
MKPTRHIKFGGVEQNATVHVESTNMAEQSQAQDEWEDNGISHMMSIETENESASIPQKQSFSNVVNGTNNVCPIKKVNFRAMVNPNKIANSDFVLLVAAVQVVKHKFENSLVGFFVGKKVAFPLVKNYVMNTWAKFGFEKIMSDDDGIFYFRFSSLTGLDQVLEQGSWLIRNVPIILTKWSPNMSLCKDEVTKVPVWVKLHKVPVVAYSEDGLSLIATQIRNPIMLDAFTSAMYVEAWGRTGFAKALIEVSADKELKQEVIMAIPKGEDESAGHTLEKIKVHEKPTPAVVENDDGFTIVTNRKSKGNGASTSHNKNFGGFRVNNTKNLKYQLVRPKDHKPNIKVNANEKRDKGIELQNCNTLKSEYAAEC